MSSKIPTSVTVLVVVVLAVLASFRMQQRVNLPDHLLGHVATTLPDFLDSETADELVDLMKQMKVFPTNSNDLKFYKTVHEHIGEAVPIGDNGRCDMHPYFVPNVNRTLCLLPGRIDVGRHFIKHGGVIGLKESTSKLISRIQSFGRYMYNPEDYPVVKRLFQSGVFQQAAEDVCPPGKHVLDPLQYNFIVSLPGQTVALHVDGVYMFGATRFHFPQWLLAVMKFSGLYEAEFIDQVQIVAYLHRWTDNRDGQFVYWDSNNEAKYIAPRPLSGSAVDGSKVVHAAMVYQPDADVPRIDKSADNQLVYQGDDVWHLMADDQLIRAYTTDDLRITLVYRARCFASDEEMHRYHAQTDADMMSLDSVLSKLSADLVRRGRVTSVEAALTMPRAELAELLLGEYISYPLPVNAMVPYNYCALTSYLPDSLAKLFSPICP
eukprot:CAMPEP_0177675650 /NCGR_PEP_ID=MMETSP0447-20121125/27322_1 /TAXON_ID=0 /ORGANISM="Stygamoeba regulata, Strain BSH-02190019" /LENGTH=434 /DNA_ID=CAMNT_0019184067 /DNA_START=33 /DNA_END=1337 /DNA_ORIENTATION=-